MARAASKKKEGSESGGRKGRISVTTAKGIARFFRAGRGFGPTPTVIDVGDLAEGDLERLQDEPRLVVTEG